MSRYAGILALLALAGAMAAAGPPSTSARYADATFRQTEGRVTVLVGSFHAGMSEGYAYLPLLVAVGLEGPGPGLSFTAASFTLVDASGKAHPAADYAALKKGYPKLSFDHHWFERKPLQIGQQFSGRQRVRASFYPPTDDGLRTTRVSLSTRTWFGDALYFPRPEAGLDGVLTLRVQAEGMERPVEVRFEVPRPSSR